MKLILFVILRVLLGLIDSSQLHGRGGDGPTGNGAWQARREEIQLHLLILPNPAFIYADSSRAAGMGASRYFRDIDGYKLCLAPPKYRFLNALLLESIRRTQAGVPDKGLLTTVIMLNAEDQQAARVALTTQQTHAVFQDLLDRVSDPAGLLRRADVEALQELLFMIGYTPPAPKRNKK